MKLYLTEKQVKTIIGNRLKEKDLSEEGAPASSAGGSTSTGTGYPEVGKWESGVTRGAGNQIGLTKWSDVVGSLLKRDKANKLK